MGNRDGNNLERTVDGTLWANLGIEGVEAFWGREWFHGHGLIHKSMPPLVQFPSQILHGAHSHSAANPHNHLNASSGRS